MRIITTTLPADKEKAKTALEVLSVAKYGLTCSRTFDNLKEVTKDMSILSDDKLSWNKNEGIKFVTKALDKTAGLAIRGIGLAATGLHNFIQHRRTKIGKNIGKYKDLNDAYEKWKEKDTLAESRVAGSNTAYNVAAKLADLENTTRPTTGAYQTNVKINDTEMGTEDAPGPLRTAINNAVEAGATDVTLPGGGTVPLDKLQHDVAIYEEATERKKLETHEGWRKANPDVISELVNYWDKMETYTKTHSFMLGSMKAKRDKMLKGWNDKESKAQQLAKMWATEYGTLRTAA